MKANNGDGGPMVLIVEDMGIQVRLTQIHLERAGYRVAAARDGNEALEQVEACSPDVILLDVELPGLNGFQVLDRLRKNPEQASIPVIMLTAHAKDAPLFSEMASPADAFMTKPFSPPDLLATVQRVLASAHDPQGAAA